eukprot:COSAG03_NODE_2134_length_3090_cov_20.282180_4_plen_97_part_00
MLPPKHLVREIVRVDGRNRTVLRCTVGGGAVDELGAVIEEPLERPRRPVEIVWSERGRIVGAAVCQPQLSHLPHLLRATRQVLDRQPRTTVTVPLN